MLEEAPGKKDATRRRARRTRMGSKRKRNIPRKGAAGHRSCYDGAATGVIFAVDVVALSILAS